MSKHLFTAAAGAAVVVMLTGCPYTKIATPALSQEEEAWEAIIRENYPGYTPPPKTSRSFQGHTEERVSAVIRPQVPAEDDLPENKEPENKTPEALPVQEETAPAEEKPAEQPAAPAEEKPAEQPAAPAEEKPAEQPAAPAEEKPAEQPAAPAEEKPAEQPAAPAEEKSAPTATGIQPPDPTDSTVYEVKSGDTLGAISQKFYGNARFSNVIFRANSDILKDPNRLAPGMKLIVPKL